MTDASSSTFQTLPCSAVLPLLRSWEKGSTAGELQPARVCCDIKKALDQVFSSWTINLKSPFTLEYLSLLLSSSD